MPTIGQHAPPGVQATARAVRRNKIHYHNIIVNNLIENFVAKKNRWARAVAQTTH
jgi:hypothetical protein